jgi:hypothetical protein
MKRGRPPAYAVIAGYRSRSGREHRVSIRRVAEGGWLVLDGSIVVQALLDGGDGARQAQAVALDYASEKQAYHDGFRPDDPLPLPIHERAQAA